MEVQAVAKPLPLPAANAPALATGAEVASADGAGQANQPEESFKARADAAATALERANRDREQLRAVLDKLNIVLDALDIQAKFSIHEATKQVMVRVVNVETGQVLREIPPERILDMAAKMMELVGILLDERM